MAQDNVGRFETEFDALSRNVMHIEELSHVSGTHISDDRGLFCDPHNGIWRVVFNREEKPTFRDFASIVASRVTQLAGVSSVGEGRVVLGLYKGERFIAGVANDVSNMTQLEKEVSVSQPIEDDVAFWMYVGMSELADLRALYVTQDGRLRRKDYETAFQHAEWEYVSNTPLRQRLAQ